MGDSIQRAIGRNLPPRVQITYDVETGGAIEKKELPFVVGIMADLSGLGDSGHDKPLKDPDRRFIEVDRDNFAEYVNSLGATITAAGTKIAITSLDDFRPEKLVEKVGLKTPAQNGSPPVYEEGSLGDLFHRRQRIRDLLTKLDSSDGALAELAAISESSEKLRAIGTSAVAEARLQIPPPGGEKGGDGAGGNLPDKKPPDKASEHAEGPPAA